MVDSLVVNTSLDKQYIFIDGIKCEELNMSLGDGEHTAKK